MTRSLFLFAAVVALAVLAQGHERMFASVARRDLEWIDFKTGDVIPENAVYAGEDIYYGGPVYVGRGKYKNQHAPGKVVKHTGLLYIVYYQTSVLLEEYQLLVANSPVSWQKADASAGIPENAVFGGHNDYEVEYYVCRALYNNKFIPGKVDRDSWKCYTEAYNNEHAYTDFELLVLV